VSDCSVGKIALQVGKKRSQVGKFDDQVGKIALQVGIAIFWKLERRVSLKERRLAVTRSSIMCFNHFVWKRKVLEWPRPLSLSGYFDGILVSAWSVGKFALQVGKK